MRLESLPVTANIQAVVQTNSASALNIHIHTDIISENNHSYLHNTTDYHHPLLGLESCTLRYHAVTFSSLCKQVARCCGCWLVHTNSTSAIYHYYTVSQKNSPNIFDCNLKINYQIFDNFWCEYF